MSRNRKYIIGVFVALSMAFPTLLHAQVHITEIMYDVPGTDTGREWIEVKNVGSSAVDFSSWKLFEANTNHKVTPVSGSVLISGGYAVIVDALDKFKADNPNFSGLIFDSAFSLGNEGETLIVRNGEGVDVDSVSYTSAMGGVGDGNTLQRKDDGTFISAPQTLGSDTTATDAASSPNTDTQTTDDTTEDNETPVQKNTDQYSTHSSQTVANISFDAPELAVTSGRSRIGFVGVPLEFEAKVKNVKNIPVGNAVANVWSMGDGSAKSGQFISHTYEYPGEYVVVLNSSMGGAEAVSKVKVKILKPDVTLAAPDIASIEIENKDGYELNVGGWSIQTAREKKMLPQDTIIAPRSKIRVPTRSLGFKHMNEYARLVNPAGSMISSVALADRGVQNSDDVMILLPKGLTVERLKELFKK